MTIKDMADEITKDRLKCMSEIELEEYYILNQKKELSSSSDEEIIDMYIEEIDPDYVNKTTNIVDLDNGESFKSIDNSHNNGGFTDYYQLQSCPFEIKDFDDFAEWRKMNGNQFNMGKVMWTFNLGRHSGTDYERDLNKIIHYAKRELLRINRKG